MFRCLTYIFSEKTLVAGTEENNIYCFEINEIFDLETKQTEFKILETSSIEKNPQENLNISSPNMRSSGNNSPTEFKDLEEEIEKN